MKLQNVTIKRPYLEDLIWKGSVLPNKYRFVVRSDVRSELQGLDERWTKLKGTCTDLVNFTSRLYSEWINCGELLKDLQIWIKKIFDAISSEKQMKYRNGAKLKDILNKYKVHEILFLNLVI